jgi:hypothetical protein
MILLRIYVAYVVVVQCNHYIHNKYFIHHYYLYSSNDCVAQSLCLSICYSEILRMNSTQSYETGIDFRTLF